MRKSNFVSASIFQLTLGSLGAAALTFLSSANAFAQAQQPLTETQNTTQAGVPSDAAKASLNSAINSASENLKFGGALEIFASAPLQNGQPDSDRGRIRSFELTSQTYFDTSLRNLSAKVTVGGFDNSGDFTFGLREGFVQGSPVRTLDIRVGKYFLPIGIYNQTRRSAWVTPSAPKVISRFFGEDGIVDTGFDLNWTPTQLFKVRAGVMNGYTFDAGESGAGLKPSTPTHYVRPTFELGGARKATVALNYVGRIDDTGESNRISGFDFTLNPSADSPRSWSLLGEAFYRETKPSGLPTARELGATLYFEQPFKTSWAAGLRADAFTIRSLTDTNGAKRSNLDWALVPVVTYEASKEIKLQASYTYLNETRSGDSNRTEQIIEIRLISELGWVPKLRGLPSDQPSL